MKRLMMLIMTLALAVLIIVIISRISILKNYELLKDDDEYALVFIAYENSTPYTMRYVVYPNRIIGFTYGLREFKEIKSPAIESPVCFQEVLHSSTGIISKKDFEEILHLTDKIDDNYNNSEGVISFGGVGLFIAYEGKYYNTIPNRLSSDDVEALEKLFTLLESVKINRGDEYGRIFQ